MTIKFDFFEKEQVKTVQDLLQKAKMTDNEEEAWDFYQAAILRLQEMCSKNAVPSGVRYLISQLRAAIWPDSMQERPSPESAVDASTVSLFNTPTHFKKFREHNAHVTQHKMGPEKS